VPFRLREYFYKKQKFTIEIGFGNGDFMIHLAEKEPEYGYLGVEVSSRSVLKLTKKLYSHGITNVRTIKLNAYMLFSIIEPAFSVSRVIYNFPDPWPDAPSRRVSSKKHLLLIHRILRKDGSFYLATDSDVLKEDMEKNAGELFYIEKSKSPYFDFRTKYERRWLSERKNIIYYRLRPATYNGDYPVLNFEGGISVAHVIFRLKDEKKDPQLNLPVRLRLEDTVIFIDRPYSREREHLYPVLVKEKGFVQKTFFKLYFTHDEARLVLFDTSYLVTTKGIRMAMACLRDMLLKTGIFEIKRDTT